METTPVSLLWPSEEHLARERKTAGLPEQFITDLDLDKVVRALSIDLRNRESLRRILYSPCTDPEVIEYRLAILEDFLKLPRLVSKIKELSPTIRRFTSLKQPRHIKGDHPLRQLGWRFEALEQYVHCTQRLQQVLALFREDVRSEGLRRLTDYLTALVESKEFKDLEAELPAVRVRFMSVSSVTIGLNLDKQLRPVEATLLSINSEPFEPKSFLGKLRGLFADGKQPHVFHSLLKRPDLEAALFRDLDGVFRDALKPVSSALARFTGINSRWYAQLESEFDFYLGAVKLINQLQAAGLPMCRPKVLPKEARVTEVKDSYSLTLALDRLATNPVRKLDEEIVTNDIRMGPEGRILVITGPNQGGKTTYLRSIGLVQVMMQAGLFVPGTEAKISPVDWVYTHFAEQEGTDNIEGRLSAELRRLAEIFETATPYSLLLLNESLASTSPGESLYLTLDIIRAVRFLGARAAFATHLHELAESIDEINRQVPGDSLLVSLVAGLTYDEQNRAQRTYRIVPAPPVGKSYAKDIARAYGISFEQLRVRLEQRRL